MSGAMIQSSITRWRRLLPSLAMGLSACGLNACTGSAVLNALTPKSGYTVERDLAYGRDPRQRLDLYLPDDAGADTPLLVFFYGGNWESGSKELYGFVGQAFASRGYVTAIPDYRALPAGPLPGVPGRCRSGGGVAARPAAGAIALSRRAFGGCLSRRDAEP